MVVAAAAAPHYGSCNAQKTDSPFSIENCQQSGTEGMLAASAHNSQPGPQLPSTTLPFATVLCRLNPAEPFGVGIRTATRPVRHFLNLAAPRNFVVPAGKLAPAHDDCLFSINGTPVTALAHEQVVNLLRHSGSTLDLVLGRSVGPEESSRARSISACSDSSASSDAATSCSTSDSIQEACSASCDGSPLTKISADLLASPDKISQDEWVKGAHCAGDSVELNAEPTARDFSLDYYDADDEGEWLGENGAPRPPSSTDGGSQNPSGLQQQRQQDLQPPQQSLPRLYSHQRHQDLHHQHHHICTAKLDWDPALGKCFSVSGGRINSAEASVLAQALLDVGILGSTAISAPTPQGLSHQFTLTAEAVHHPPPGSPPLQLLALSRLLLRLNALGFDPVQATDTTISLRRHLSCCESRVSTAVIR